MTNEAVHFYNYRWNNKNNNTRMISIHIREGDDTFQVFFWDYGDCRLVTALFIEKIIYES